jgi:hypothetical protein
MKPIFLVSRQAVTGGAAAVRSWIDIVFALTAVDVDRCRALDVLHRVPPAVR